MDPVWIQPSWSISSGRFPPEDVRAFKENVQDVLHSQSRTIRPGPQWPGVRHGLVQLVDYSGYTRGGAIPLIPGDIYLDLYIIYYNI